jgi:hypothetical protein
MPRSLQLSELGRELVKDAIKAKEWAIYDVRWLIEVSRHLDLDSDINWDNYLALRKNDLEAEVALIATVSKSTWRRFLKQEAINTATFVACCKALQLNCWTVADKIPLDSTKHVFGVKADYIDPESYTGPIWTFIKPEDGNFDQEHLISIYWGSWSWQNVMTLPGKGLLLKYVKRFPDLHKRVVVVSSPLEKVPKMLITSSTKIVNTHLELPDVKTNVDINWGWEQRWLTPPIVKTLL